MDMHLAAAVPTLVVQSALATINVWRFNHVKICCTEVPNAGITNAAAGAKTQLLQTGCPIATGSMQTCHLAFMKTCNF